MIFFSFQIGNAYIDYETEYKGMYDYAWTHALISDEIHEGILSNCNFVSGSTITEACLEYTEQADELLNTIDQYGIYAPFCSSSTPPPKVKIKPPNPFTISSFIFPNSRTRLMYLTCDPLLSHHRRY